MKRLLYILILTLSIVLPSQAEEKEGIDVPEIIFGHLGDTYEWHIAGDAVIHLPCIVYSGTSGWHVFMSDKVEEGKTYEGFCIDKETGKLTEVQAVNDQAAPADTPGSFFLDISITKNVLQLFIVCIVLCSVILGVASWYRRNGYKKAPGGFVGMIEAVLGFVDQDVVKSNIGHGYEKFSPFLCTIFFFILTCNLLGLIPIFPGGANLTGNIAVTMTLAISSWIAINFFAPKEYYKSIIWPDVPIFLKAPLPIMPAIEFIGIFTKPFSLTIRLFANIFAGHAIILSLTCIIFVTWQTSALVGAPMTIVSVLFCIFMNCLELLVAFVQAYVFTLLTASFIGLAHNE